MRDGPHIARVAALIGDATRAEVLTALMADRALTATELAERASVTKPTMSAHLARLVDAGLVAVAAQGRHRYYRLAGHDVAELLESLMGVAFRTGAVRLRGSPREPALRHARTCYDHLAGERAVALYEALLNAGILQKNELDALTLTAPGADWLKSWGLDVAAWPAHGRRPLCRTCVDWSERRHHLGGALGAALLARFQALGWLRRDADSRVVRFTPPGEQALAAWLRSAEAMAAGASLKPCPQPETSAG